MTQKMNIFGGIKSAMSGKGPWDRPNNGAESGTEDGGGSGDNDSPRPSGPWIPRGIDGGKAGQQNRKKPSLDELFRKGGGGSGGGFGGLPTGPGGKSIVPYMIGGFILLWIVFTSFHRIGAQEQGVVTQLGKYNRTEGSGIAFTLPAPFERMEKVDTGAIRTMPIGTAAGNQENLVLTSDQNIIDMAYEVRWSVSNPENFLFQIKDAEQTVQEVAESAMRATIANFPLNDAIGPGRGSIEQGVRARMQEILDGYNAGVLVQGIAIRQADPPESVIESFRKVNAAQQTKESALNDARKYARQVTERAEGDVAEFDKIYEEYRQAPEVTKRRLYYETMESVLSNVDKTIVESGNVTPYLPLPEIKKRAAPQTATPSAAQGGAK
ncbi:protease modulator HflK [Sphingorhabdus lutea]|uniref:Protease modulator HflK n=1 Tax=Sphingorhabdus lutea TaxID=1913578 RepID=A0A1L3JEI6_9SPHN|nr:protease modulator HflK [Sphingorhabdus lutea]APG63558.1 protease modulator HflK [Sphingorhabdus lutea]